jgi:hypothetical protein
MDTPRTSDAAAWRRTKVTPSPLQAIIERAIVPALLARLLAQHAAAAGPDESRPSPTPRVESDTSA